MWTRSPLREKFFLLMPLPHWPSNTSLCRSGNDGRIFHNFIIKSPAEHWGGDRGGVCERRVARWGRWKPPLVSKWSFSGPLTLKAPWALCCSTFITKKVSSKGQDFQRALTCSFLLVDVVMKEALLEDASARRCQETAAEVKSQVWALGGFLGGHERVLEDSGISEESELIWAGWTVTQHNPTGTTGKCVGGHTKSGSRKSRSKQRKHEWVSSSWRRIYCLNMVTFIK